MRKQVIKILKTDLDCLFEETSISPFELQKADELFITNVVRGVLPVTNYRKKHYTTDFSKKIISKLNTKINLS